MPPIGTKSTRADRAVNPQDPSTWLAPGQSLIGADGRDWSWAYAWFEDVPGFPGYKAEWHGTVWSCRCKGRLRDTWKRLRGSIQKASTNAHYVLHCLYGDDGSFFIRRHQIMALAFLGPCPDGKEVRHIDGNGLNNQLDNLAYGTRGENVADRDLHGTMPRGETHPDAKVSDADVDEIRSLIAKGATPRELSDIFPLSESYISSLAKGRWRRMPAHKT